MSLPDCVQPETGGNLCRGAPAHLYPALLKLEQEGLISSAWGVSDNNRRLREPFWLAVRILTM